MAAIFGLFIAIPVLRLGGDYLGIATLGFAEIIRVLIVNLTPITNGSLGIKGIPFHASLLVNYGWLLITLYCMVKLLGSNFGNIFKAIRDDEIAAKVMGIDTFRTKVLSFCLGAFFAGVGGALLGNLLTTIDPKMFTFLLTFNVLMIVVAAASVRSRAASSAARSSPSCSNGCAPWKTPSPSADSQSPASPACAWSCSRWSSCASSCTDARASWECVKSPGTPSSTSSPGETRMTSFAQNGLLLDVQHVTMRFGGITAVNDLSMPDPTGSITGLIGPNGAGQDHGLQRHQRLLQPPGRRHPVQGPQREGLPAAPDLQGRAWPGPSQNIRLFGSETALENVMVGCQVRRKSQWWMPVFSLPSARREEEEIRGKAKGLIHRLALDSYMNEKASSLPYGRSGALKSPAPWRPARTSCSSTSPPPG